MNVRNTRRLARTAALLVAVIAVVAPVARASTPDALARYLTAHRASPDAIDRWLAGHDLAPSFTENPISDVVSSLRVARTIDQHARTPVSDVASSLGLSRDRLDRTIANAPQPISDTADSLAVARQVAAASTDTTEGAAGFAWQDAAIGAGAALLFLAIGACSRLLLRRHRQLAA